MDGDNPHLCFESFHCAKEVIHLVPIHLFPRITEHALWAVNWSNSPSRDRLYQNMALPLLANTDIPAKGQTVAPPVERYLFAQ